VTKVRSPRIVRRFLSWHFVLGELFYDLSERHFNREEIMPSTTAHLNTSTSFMKCRIT
jgi:hypothetical protein